MRAKREYWVDFVKAYACILVVLGHFFQSMIASDIIQRSFITTLFNSTIYYFHVPLFFICSGYLYQKYTKVNDFTQWKNNSLKKLLTLGVPYFVFSTVTWILKTLFSGYVNNESDDILTSLFLKPISPYWYLYALFFLFIIIPTFQNRKIAKTALVIALILKAISFIPYKIDIYALNTVLDNAIWFVIGMCLESFGFGWKFPSKKHLSVSIAFGIVFVFSSIILCIKDISSYFIGFILGLLACFSTILLSKIYESSHLIKKVSLWCAEYTLPVFLMHTIFAASLRSLLFKLGINSVSVHIILGIFITFAGPVIACLIMRRVKWMDFLLKPSKYVKLK